MSPVHFTLLTLNYYRNNLVLVLFGLLFVWHIAFVINFIFSIVQRPVKYVKMWFKTWLCNLKLGVSIVVSIKSSGTQINQSVWKDNCLNVESISFLNCCSCMNIVTASSQSAQPILNLSLINPPYLRIWIITDYCIIRVKN